MKMIAKYMTQEPAGFKWSKYVKNYSRCAAYNIKENCIILSPRYVELNKRKHVLNSILHEIAHALTPGSGHNAIWARQFKAIGGNGQRLASSEIISK